MWKNNKGKTNIKNILMIIMVFILALVCIYQGLRLSTLSDENGELGEQLKELNHQLIDIQNKMDDLDTTLYEYTNSKDADVTYEIVNMDWENKNMEVRFNVQLLNATENKTVYLNNTKEEIELTKNGDVYTGTINYPIREQMYKTTLRVEEKIAGGTRIYHYFEEEIGASTWATLVTMGGFDGYICYGNGKLHISGSMDYSLDVEDKVSEVHYEIGSAYMKTQYLEDEEIEDENARAYWGKHGKIELDNSMALKNTELEDGVLYHETVRVVITMESGITYYLYPEILATENYEADVERVNYTEVIQKGELHVSLPDGSYYELTLDRWNYLDDCVEY